MRWILRVLITIVVVFFAYWWGVKLLIEAQAPKLLPPVMQAEVSVTGFPARFDINLNKPHLYLPEQQIEWSADQAKLHAVAWSPWHMILALPAEQNLTLSGKNYLVQSKALRASLRLTPLPDLPLNDLRIGFDEVTVAGLQFGESLIALRHGGDAFYQLGAKLQALPQGISAASANMLLELDRPLDRFTQNPLLMGLEIQELRLNWPDISLNMQGNLRPDNLGFAEGRLTLAVEGWQVLPMRLVEAGLLPADRAALFTSALTLLAAQSQNPETINLPLNLTGGEVKFGFLTLGRAPLLR